MNATAKTSSPRIEQAANRAALVLTHDEVTKELYGYAAPALDLDETMKNVIAEYLRPREYRMTEPNGEERKIAIGILEERMAALLARS